MFAGSAAEYLEKRALCCDDFYVVKSTDFSRRLVQIFDQCLHVVDASLTNRNSKTRTVQLTAMVDLLRNAIFAGRYWGGFSNLTPLLERMGMFASMRSLNLPSWELLCQDEESLEPFMDEFNTIVDGLSHRFRLPSAVDVPWLLDVTSRIFTSQVTIEEKLVQVVILYQRDLAAYLSSRSDNDYSHLIDGKSIA